MEPFASLLMLPHCTVPRLLVNREPVGPFKHCKGRTTDVAVTGDLVEGVRGLAREAGWGKELEALVAGAGGSVDVISTAVGCKRLHLHKADMMSMPYMYLLLMDGVFQLLWQLG